MPQFVSALVQSVPHLLFVSVGIGVGVVVVSVVAVVAVVAVEVAVVVVVAWGLHGNISKLGKHQTFVGQSLSYVHNALQFVFASVQSVPHLLVSSVGVGVVVVVVVFVVVVCALHGDISVYI